MINSMHKDCKNSPNSQRTELYKNISNIENLCDRHVVPVDGYGSWCFVPLLLPSAFVSLIFLAGDFEVPETCSAFDSLAA